MGRVVVATPAGINGLDLTPEKGVLVGTAGTELASQIRRLRDDSDLRREMERLARVAALDYNWSAIARKQSEVYRSLL